MQYDFENMVHFKAKQSHFNTLPKTFLNITLKPNIP